MVSILHIQFAVAEMLALHSAWQYISGIATEVSDFLIKE
jgi:hypothetical protein